MSGFANSVVGGAANLVRQAIQSVPFVSGSQGWRVQRNGNAEFNNATIRGAIVGPNWSIGNSGEFRYGGSIPGFGNLIYSDTNAAGTDIFGNAYLAGTTTYFFNGSIFLATQLWQGKVQFAWATGAGGPWNTGDPMIFGDNGGGLTLQSIAEDVLVRLTAKNGLLIGSVTGAILNSVHNGVLVAQQPGAAQFTAEPWHDLRPLSNSFGGTITNEFPPQYRMSLEGFVDIFGAVQTPASGSYNGITWATLPVGYRPAKFTSFPVAQIGGTMATDTNTGSPRLYTDSSGVLQFFGISPSINSSTIRFSGRFPVTNAPIQS